MREELGDILKVQERDDWDGGWVLASELKKRGQIPEHSVLGHRVYRTSRLLECTLQREKRVREKGNQGSGPKFE